MNLKNLARNLPRKIPKENEITQIKSDKRLLERLKAGHNDAKQMKGRFIDE